MPIHVALGSWADADYAGLTYPRGFAPDMRLSGYAMWFDCMEVNATYYQLPKTAAVANWLAATPESFRFTIRLHRVLSQSPEKSAREGRLLKIMLENLRPLWRQTGSRLSCSSCRRSSRRSGTSWTNSMV